MTQKERLVELFRNSPGVFAEGSEMEYAVADFLLSNGVIVLPPIDEKCFDEFLYETDKIITEYYCKKTGQEV